MGLNDLQPAPGSRKDRKRKGRGPGSGLGKTAGKGHKGSKARSGGQTARGFEGGQMPLYRRLPKRGFRNTMFATNYTVVLLRDLERFEAGTTVDLDAVVEAGLVQRDRFSAGLKVLATGELTKALTVKAAKCTAGARAAIEGAGGTVEEG